MKYANRLRSKNIFLNAIDIKIKNMNNQIIKINFKPVAEIALRK